ncbi:hypothetical protein [Kribbella catacumbae]|uniref:hypothetical protein n=1 Tax=Kribbella catacumbae TaxID=460086 RepID=UPI000377A22C|nr:hypothetical protein [Kribbella catacumbae]
MSSAEQRSVAGALGSFVASLAAVSSGGFVFFNDTPDTVNHRNLPLGAVAMVLVIAGVVVAARTATARLWLGGALGLLDVFLIWQSTTNNAFRFVWGSGEGEMFMFQVVLGLTALVLIATGLQPSRQTEPDTEVATELKPGAGRWLVRAAGYLCGTVIIVFVATWAGIDYYTPTICDDCLDGLKGLYWGMAAVLACLVAVVVIELVLRSRRRQERTEGIRA